MYALDPGGFGFPLIPIWFLSQPFEKTPILQLERRLITILPDQNHQNQGWVFDIQSNKSREMTINLIYT